MALADHNYPDLAVPWQSHDRVPVDRWFPASAPSPPARVIKKNGRERAFNAEQFESSIGKAMLGRSDAEERSAVVAQWVLWGIHGQSVLHSSQLAVGVLDCLRRVDDIAYLRWAAIAKGLTSVPQLRDEALQLVSAPSARLVFDAVVQPRRPPVQRHVAPLERMTGIEPAF